MAPAGFVFGDASIEHSRAGCDDGLDTGPCDTNTSPADPKPAIGNHGRHDAATAGGHGGPDRHGAPDGNGRAHSHGAAHNNCAADNDCASSRIGIVFGVRVGIR